MNNIEWKDGAVCFSNGVLWGVVGQLNLALRFKDFQLNEPRIGDYMLKSELNTEQKYNDAVEVFGLFGFEKINDIVNGKNIQNSEFTMTYASNASMLLHVKPDHPELYRKLTYPQLMAIGKLKRAMNERDNVNYSENPNSSEAVMQKNKPVVAQVMIDLTERMEIGIKTYGEALRANNGRDALQDAYEEALDLACYLKQAMIERDNANTN